MSLPSLFFLAIGLSMDAFAVAVCKGLATSRITVGKSVLTGFWFGGFQALMPVLGYLAGYRFQEGIAAWDHWIAFILLLFIGGSMIKEAFCQKEENASDSFAFKEMFLLAVATSIDALAVGVTFAFLPDIPIIPAVSFIGIITFLFSSLGLKIGNVFGTKYKAKAELAGGVILIFIGLKILIEHLFF